MSDYETKNNTGALFNNVANKKTDKHPDYTGNAVINGKKVMIGAWIKESIKGTKYLSLAFSEYRPKTEDTREYVATSTSDSAEIPF